MYKRIAATAAAAFLAMTMTQNAAGQPRVAPDPTYRAPRTVDRQPDISGIWRNDTLTPLERPSGLGDQEFYTEEEASEIETRGREMREADSAPGATRTTVGGSLDIGYNWFWSDPRDSVVYTRRTSMIADPPTGRVPTRPEAEARAAWLVANRTDSHENMSPYSRCITRGVPGSMLPNTYNTGNHIFQIPGYVVVLYEMVREPRIIPLDGRPFVDSKIAQWMGDARGRWEGETLVVETRNFTEKAWITPNQNAGRMHGIPVSPELAVGGALHQGGRGRPRLAGAGRGSQRLHAAVDPGAAAAARHELRPVRVRVPRRQSRRNRHPRRGAPRGAAGSRQPLSGRRDGAAQPGPAALLLVGFRRGQV